MACKWERVSEESVRALSHDDLISNIIAAARADASPDYELAAHAYDALVFLRAEFLRRLSSEKKGG